MKKKKPHLLIQVGFLVLYIFLQKLHLKHQHRAYLDV